MTDPDLYVTVAVAGLTGLGMVTVAAHAGWRGWLDLKREAMVRHGDDTRPATSAGTRIEMADLKERIRRLEAIAAGVDL